MSKRVQILVAGVALLVAMFFWFGGARDWTPLAPPERTEVAQERPNAPTEQKPRTNELDAPAVMPRETALAPQPVAPIETAKELCILFGRTADENDQGLAGVAVRVAAYKVWADGVDVPRLPGKIDMRGFEMTTGDDGRFRFEGPVPTAQSPWLTLEPDPFHDSARLILGGKRAEAKAPLHAGENDFGTIRLVTTGAIRGSVRDEAGAPIVEAKLMLGPERSSTLQRDAFSDANGQFVVGHSPAGPMGLNASAEGYLSEFRKPIDVVLGRYTENVDFVLRKAPTLSGIVVDDIGRPIEGVKLWGWPESYGAGAGGKSLADGTFAVALPQEEPYTLEATREGFEAFGVGDRSKHYPPGSHDLRIVMKRLAALTLCVVDARTDQPITKFGHAVLPNMSKHTPHSSYTETRSPPGVDRPDGRVSLSFRPGIDVVDIAASGYESQRFDPEPGNPPDGSFVVKLVANASVFGRVRVAGAPAGGVALRLESGQMEVALVDGSETASTRFVPERDGAVLGTSAADGSFRFDIAPRGTFRLMARTAGGEVACVNEIRVATSSAIDLGNIDLVAGAALRGVVLVPAGRRAVGLSVRIDNPHYGESQLTDADGRFHFDALVAGAHELFLDDVPGSISLVPPTQVQLAPGEVLDVQIDAREFGTCAVDLTILIGGSPAANAQVSLTRADTRKRIRLGTTDRYGRVAGSAPLALGVGIEVWTADRIQMDHPTARLDLTLDARIVETIRFETASVVLVLPKALVLPAKCSMLFELTSSSVAMAGPSARTIDVVDGAKQDSHVTASEGGHRLRFDDVLAGEWQLVFDVSDSADPFERVQLTADSWKAQRKTMYRWTSALKLESGQTVIVDLH